MADRCCELEFFLNGTRVLLKQVEPNTSLLDFLRDSRRLSGTKRGCDSGGCGACTVMISRQHVRTRRVVHVSATACLVPLCSLHAQAVTTVEGVGAIAQRVHQVQQRLADSHGTQCGFCSPGMVMSMYTLLRNQPEPTVSQITCALQGNLCRCTGYRPILEAFSTFSPQEARCARKHCCRSQMGSQTGKPELGEKAISTALNDLTFRPIDPTQEPLFPPYLIESGADKQSAVFRGHSSIWHAPVTISEVNELRRSSPNARLVAGNTSIGLLGKQPYSQGQTFISLANVQQLATVEWNERGLMIGATVTITELAEILQTEVKRDHITTRHMQAIITIINRYGSLQIRNLATVGGSLMTNYNNSDLLVMLMAINAEICLMDVNEKTSLVATRTFHDMKIKMNVQDKYMITGFVLPSSASSDFSHFFKQTNRKEFELALVNIGLYSRIKNDELEMIRVNIGGISDQILTASLTENHLKGMQWNYECLQSGLKYLLHDICRIARDNKAAFTEYQQTLILSVFYKLFLKTSRWMNFSQDHQVDSECEETTARDICSSQLFQIAPSQCQTDVVGTPIPHLSSVKQTTGEAMYTDDITPAADEKHAALVLSQIAHGKIEHIDASSALQVEGVTHFISAKDISTEKNKYGALVMDEEIFRSETVTSMGQIIGVVLAEHKNAASLGASRVQVKYTNLPVTVTIEQALTNSSFLGEEQTLEFGDWSDAIKKAECVIKGKFRMGGQEHFYLEPMTCRVEIRDGEDLLVNATSQNPSDDQLKVAHMLGIPSNRVTCRTKRLGGAFGGKESRCQPMTLATAFAAYTTKSTVRLVLDRREDMMSTGNRHPMLADYTVGSSMDGLISGMVLEIYSNGGCSEDVSSLVMAQAVRHCCGAYKIPAYKIKGRVCRTNVPSNTAFRGFGTPQGFAIAEAIIDHLGRQLNIDAVKIRQKNLIKSGDCSLIRKPLEDVTVGMCLEECIKMSAYHERRACIEQFNSKHHLKKRGISVTPSHFPIGLTLKMLEQGACMMNAYKDGTVLISIGGIEMGQGLFTKCCQIATRALGVPLDKVYIKETCTDVVPNATATVGSRGTDLFGGAVKNACEELKKRLEPYENAEGVHSFEDLVKRAYMDQVSLSVVGHHTPGGVTFRNNDLYNYYVSGAACCEVEVDCLTGSHSLLRTDIVMDIGESLNPAIDIGQIEGAFMQGYGLLCMERVRYSRQGVNLTCSPNTYKIPGLADIPPEFNVSLLRPTRSTDRAQEPRAVYSSRAVGEPPLLSATAALLAIKHAVAAARRTSTAPFALHSPATCDRVRAACCDWIVDMVRERGVNKKQQHDNQTDLEP